MGYFGKDTWFYNQSIRRYTVLFGSIFNDLYIKRVVKDEQGNSTSEDMIKVPLRFGPGFIYEKVDSSSDTREGPRIKQILPAMAFELTDIIYDSNGKLNEFQRIKSKVIQENQMRNWVFNPQPYKFEYTLHIKTKNMDDMLQIVEQIIPPFNTGLTIRCEDLDENQVTVQRDIVLNLINFEIKDNYEDVIAKEAREITAEFIFTLNGYLYGRVRNTPVVLETEILGLLGDNVMDATPIDVMFSYSLNDNQALIEERQLNINVAEEFRQVEDNLFGFANPDNVTTKSGTKTRRRRKST